MKLWFAESTRYTKIVWNVCWIWKFIKTCDVFRRLLFKIKSIKKYVQQSKDRYRATIETIENWIYLLVSFNVSIQLLKNILSITTLLIVSACNDLFDWCYRLGTKLIKYLLFQKCEIGFDVFENRIEIFSLSYQ